MKYEFLVVDVKASSIALKGQANTVGIIGLLENMTDMNKEERNVIMNDLDEKKFAYFVSFHHHEKKYDIKITEIQ